LDRGDKVGYLLGFYSELRHIRALGNLKCLINSRKNFKFYFEGPIVLILLFFPFVLTYSMVSATSVSPVLEREWDMTYGGDSGDVFYSVITTEDGYVAVGYKTTKIASDRDMWLIITDSRGNVLKDKVYGSNEYDVGYSVIQTENGYIIAGYTSSNNDNNVWLVSVDTLGNGIWNKTFGGSRNDIAYSIQKTSDNGYLLIGSTHSFGVNGDVWLIKVNSTGFEEWNRTYGGVNNEIGYSVIEVSDGYIFAGSTKTFGMGGNDMWLVKTNLLGEKVWSKRFGGPNDDSASSVVQTEDGGFLLAGYTSSYGEGGQEIWLVKTDSQGNEVWSKRFGGPNDDSASSVVQTEDGGYIITGLTRSYGANGNVLLIKTNQYGLAEWSELLGGSSWDVINHIEPTLDGGIILSGSSQSFDDKGAQGWLIKMKPVPTPTPSGTGGIETSEINETSGIGVQTPVQTPIHTSTSIQIDDSVTTAISEVESEPGTPGFGFILGVISLFTTILLRRGYRN